MQERPSIMWHPVMRIYTSRAQLRCAPLHWDIAFCAAACVRAHREGILEFLIEFVRTTQSKVLRFSEGKVVGTRKWAGAYPYALLRALFVHPRSADGRVPRTSTSWATCCACTSLLSPCRLQRWRNWSKSPDSSQGYHSLTSRFAGSRPLAIMSANPPPKKPEYVDPCHAVSFLSCMISPRRPGASCPWARQLCGISHGTRSACMWDNRSPSFLASLLTCGCNDVQPSGLAIASIPASLHRPKVGAWVDGGLAMACCARKARQRRDHLTGKRQAWLNSPPNALAKMMHSLTTMHAHSNRNS